MKYPKKIYSGIAKVIGSLRSVRSYSQGNDYADQNRDQSTPTPMDGAKTAHTIHDFHWESRNAGSSDSRASATVERESAAKYSS